MHLNHLMWPVEGVVLPCASHPFEKIMSKTIKYNEKIYIIRHLLIYV